MNPVAEAERRSEYTGRSFNKCLDDIWEEDMDRRQYEATERQQYEEEMRQEYEKEAQTHDN
jgi:hypothetical protein